MSVWYFEKRDRRGVQTVPKNEEHFAAVSGVVTSLIREMTQNSGDAPPGNEPVQMVFRLGKLDANRFADYVEGLPEHFEQYPDQRALLAGNRMVPYLVIEDFGTTGLEGLYGLDADAADSNYVAFWRRYGESSKTDEHGGRHGLGKSTIASASKLRLFFGVTVRSNDPARHLLLQGQISLKPHKVGSEVYDAYGLWYDVSDDLFLPLIDKAAARFMHDFELNRGKNPGLSVVIPFPADDLNADNVIKAVIENTFHQIITEQLIVTVDDTKIDAKTIFRLADKYCLGSLKSAMALSARVAKNDFPRATPRQETAKLRLKAEHFSDAAVQQMRERWIAGEVVAVDLPVRVQKRKMPRSEIGQVALFVRREPNSDLTRETYVRGRVTVPLRQMAGRSNCVGLLAADKGIASTFLGDAEPPAHNRWLLYRVRPHYIGSDAALRRIWYALKDFLDLVEEGKDDQPIKDAFVEYLSIPKAAEDDDDNPRPRPRPTPSPIPVPTPKPTVTPHSLRRIDGGFAYSYDPGDNEDVDGTRIVVSYRRRTGSNRAPKSVKFRDFPSEMPIEESSVADLEQVPEPRRVIFNLANISPGYELRVTGFDTNRDLELRLETVTA